MNVEIIEFYPSEYRDDKRIVLGTLRVKLPEVGLHILGVFASRRNDRWFFGLPGRKAIHNQTGKEIRYPFIVFEDRAKQKELMDAIREKGPLFIENWLANPDNNAKIPLRIEKQKSSSSTL